MSFLSRLLAATLRGPARWMSRRAIIDLAGSHKALDSEVIIEVDENGVPTIRAQGMRDALFMQGYIHAAERLWAMELNRRACRGMLSEVFGEDALETDIMARTFGFERRGIQDWEGVISDELKDLVEAYIAGINRFLDEGHPLPVEFRLAGFKPAKFTHVDVMALGRFMVWQLSHAWHGVITRWQLVNKVGEDMASELSIKIPESIPPILRNSGEMQVLVDGVMKKLEGIYIGQQAASNAISISGSLTESGMPMNANDMHLAVTTPSLWYMMVMDYGETQVRGVSLPGAPLILVGGNSYFSWGATLAYTDAADVFLEKVSGSSYEFKGEKLPLKEIRESIAVKGGKVEQVIIHETHHGPIVHQEGGYAMAVCDRSLQPSNYLDGFRRLNVGRGWDDFVDAARQITATQLNLTYAGIDGNIGYWTTGEVPVRSHDGLLPVEGWTGQFDWQEFIPFEEMPHALNPSKGYIVTANHRIVDEDYPHFLGKVYMNGYRAQRIGELLDEIINSGKKITGADVNRIMYDEYCIPAKKLVEQLQSYNTEDPVELELLEILRSWDFVMDVESRGGCVYEVLRFNLVRTLLETHLDEDLLMRVLGIGPNPVLLDANEFYGHETNALLRILENADSLWLRSLGGRNELISKGLKRTSKYLRNRLGAPSKWRYGSIHHIRFPHAFDIVPYLAPVFNVQAREIGGNTDTPKQTGMFSNQPFDNSAWSISFRFLVDYGHSDEFKVAMAPGQSGHLASRHYSDLVERWLNGEYIFI